MERIMKMASKYVQNKGALLAFREHTKDLGKSYYAIASGTAEKVTAPKIEKSLENSGAKIHFEKFGGVCCDSEIKRLAGAAKSAGSDVIVGVGGGSTLDTAKAVAFMLRLPVVIVPTVASTDAPCSALSVIYTEAKEFDRYQFYPKNPDAVIVDTQVIADAPVRFFVAGMGDALATYFEGRSCKRADTVNMVGGHLTNAGLALARLCYDTLISDGYKAKLAVENSVVTESVEAVTEANILLSGAGFENAGLAAAHSFYDGFTTLPECKKSVHGELVAFGTIVQLVLDNSPMSEINEVLAFSRSVGLPTTLKEIGVTETGRIRIGAEAACAPAETINNMLGGVTPDQLTAAIIEADALGSSYR